MGGNAVTVELIDVGSRRAATLSGHQDMICGGSKRLGVSDYIEAVEVVVVSMERM
jgi:hypothetical protein